MNRILADGQAISNAISSLSASGGVCLIPSSKTWLLSKKTSSNVLVLDSSFNPPTRAHIGLIHAATRIQGVDYDGLLLMLSTANVDKELKGGSVQDRISMMEICAEKISKNVAVVLTDKARFIDKARAIRELPGFKASTLSFLLGMDTVTRFFDIKYYGTRDAMMENFRQFFASSLIVAAERADSPSLAEFLTQTPDARLFQHRILLCPKSENEELESVSSTQCRRLFAEAENNADNFKRLERLTFPEIIQYCVHHKIFRNV